MGNDHDEPEFVMKRVPRDELKAGFQLLAEAFDDSLENEEVWNSFGVARDAGDADTYAGTILERAKAGGVLRAACEDVGDALGMVDYDEAVWALRGTVRQWHHIAGRLEPTSRTAVHVRTAAEELRAQLDNPGFDPEILPDVISIACLDSELMDLALSWKRAQEMGSEEVFWVENEDRASQAFVISSGLKADLRNRGELGLDDELLPPGDDLMEN